MPQNASAKLLLIFLLSKCLTLFLLDRRIFPSLSDIYLLSILLCNHFYRLASSHLLIIDFFFNLTNSLFIYAINGIQG